MLSAELQDGLKRFSWSLLAVLLAVSTPASSQPANPVPIDFSYAGYEAGAPIPLVKAVLVVKPSGGDDTALIQGALDKVAARPLGTDGFRGAVQLASGRFRISGQLHLRASGVVLRGSGREANGTTLLADGIGRRTLIEVGAEKDVSLDAPIAVEDDVAAGGRKLHLASMAGLNVGDHVVVRRPSTDEWINAIGMTGLPGTFANQRLDWKPGSHDLVWDRTIAAIDGPANVVEIDAPITTALEHKYGGGTLARVSDDTAPEHIGVENLVLESSFDGSRPKDEEHSWIAVLLDHVQDAWVRDVTARHFVSSAVRVNLRGRRITVEDCRSEAPVYRRRAAAPPPAVVPAVWATGKLVQHCHSEAGMNDFASGGGGGGMLAGGPNVFLDCDDATGSLGWRAGRLRDGHPECCTSRCTCRMRGCNCCTTSLAHRARDGPRRIP